MFAEFLKRLTAPKPAQFADEDARLALTALLVRIARADGDYAAAEIARIDRINIARYGFDEAEALALRTSAENLEKEAPDTVRFTRAIKDAVPFEAREAVIEAMWDVALADGVRETHEETLLRLVSNLLGVNDRDSNIARQRVQATAK